MGGSIVFCTGKGYISLGCKRFLGYHTEYLTSKLFRRTTLAPGAGVAKSGDSRHDEAVPLYGV